MTVASVCTQAYRRYVRTGPAEGLSSPWSSRVRDGKRVPPTFVHWPPFGNGDFFLNIQRRHRQAHNQILWSETQWEQVSGESRYESLAF